MIRERDTDGSTLGRWNDSSAHVRGPSNPSQGSPAAPAVMAARSQRRRRKGHVATSTKPVRVYSRKGRGAWHFESWPEFVSGLELELDPDVTTFVSR